MPQVQRPEAFDLASIDISLLRGLAAYLKKVGVNATTWSCIFIFF